MYFKRKILITISLTIALMVAIGFSYAIFMAVPVKGNNNVNTITGNTISSSTLQPNIVVTYDEGTNYIDTGDLVLTTEPLNQIIKFKAYTIYDGAVNIEVSLSTVKNTLTADANYYLYECTESAYNAATYDNLSTTCTSIGQTSDNVLPIPGDKVFIHQARSVIINGPGTKYLVFAYTIPASNATKRYIGVINANLKDMTPFDFTYNGTYIDQRVDGIGSIYFTSSGTLTVTNGKTDVAVEIIGAGGGGGGGGGGYYEVNTGCYHQFFQTGGYGTGGGSGYHTNMIMDILNNQYVFTIGIGGNGGTGGSGGYETKCGGGSILYYTATDGTGGGSGTATIAFGTTMNAGTRGFGGGEASRSNNGRNSTLAGTGEHNGSGMSGGSGFSGYGAGGNGGAGGYGSNGGAGVAGQSGAVILTFN